MCRRGCWCCGGRVGGFERGEADLEVVHAVGQGGNELDHCLHFFGKAFEGKGCVLCIERGADSDQENNDKENEKVFFHCSSLPFTPLG